MTATHSRDCDEEAEEDLAYYLCSEDSLDFDDSYEIREHYRQRACNIFNAIGQH